MSTATASSGGAGAGGSPRLRHAQLLTAFSGVMLAVVMASLDNTIVATALPTIADELGGLEQLAWVVTVYLLAQTVVTPIYGKLGDLYGRRRLFQVAILIFLVGSIFCGGSQTMGQLIVSRFVQGAGAGGMIVLSMASVADLVSPRERGRYQGYFGAVYVLSSVAGPFLGGFFTDHLSWRWAFYVNVPVAVLAIVVIGTALPGTPRRESIRIDYLGAALIALASTGIVLVTTWGGTEHEWGSPLIVGLLACSGTFAALFLVVQARAPEPIMPLRLFRLRAVSLACAIIAISVIVLYAVITFVPLFLQGVTGVSASSSGVLLLPNVVGVFVGSLVQGQVASRTGRYRFFPVIGMALMGSGLFLLAALTVDASQVEVGVYMAMIGLGSGITMPVLTVASQNAVPVRDIGVVTSAINYTRTIGATVGLAVFGAIFNASLTRSLGDLDVPVGEGTSFSSDVIAGLDPAQRADVIAGFAESITTVFLVAAPLCVVGFVLALLVKADPLRRDGEEPHDVPIAAATAPLEGDPAPSGVGAGETTAVEPEGRT